MADEETDAAKDASNEPDAESLEGQGGASKSPQGGGGK